MSEIRLAIAKDVPAKEAEIAAEDAGLRYDTSRENLDPITAAVVIGGGLALGKFLLRLWNEIQGGTVIDVRETPIKIDRSRDLAFGYFMVVAKDGSVTIETKDEPESSIERMVESVLKLPIDATVSTIKAAIESASTGEAEVSEEPATA